MFCYDSSMNFLDALILGSLQGVTEFLPISSSGHLVLMEEFLGLHVEELKSFDVVVHMGTLLAILIYFWPDVKQLLFATGRILKGKIDTKDQSTRMIGWIIIATIPAVIVGLTFEDKIDAIFRNTHSVAINSLIVGCIFIFAEFFTKAKFGEKFREMNWVKSLFVGLAQALALIPGVSRSGSTIVTGIFQGISRVEAARFSFLIGIPAIAGAGLLTGMKVMKEGLDVSITALTTGFISSFILGILSVHFLMTFLRKRGLFVFGVYRILLALGILIYL